MNGRTLVNIALIIMISALIFNAGTFGYGLFIALFAFFGLQLIYSIAKYAFRHRIRNAASHKEYVLNMTAMFMGLFFVTGSIIFAFTFPVIKSGFNADFNNAEIVIRSMICSLDLFMLDVDSNILDRLDNHALLKGLIVIQGAFSFSSTVALLMSLVYSRVRAHYILNRRTKITEKNNHLYLFFGICENSRLLATDIRKNDPRAVIILIDDANVNNDDNDIWNNIVNLISHRQGTFDLADNSKALVAIASKQPCALDDADLGAASGDILSMIGLRKIKEFILALAKHPDDSQLHIFFLSDNEDNNILSLLNIAKDETILAVAGNKAIKDKIYCHARFNGPNRVVEDIAVRKCLTVEIIDSSHLAVELLKSDSAGQPVRVARLSDSYPATVAEPLNALIVGFGEVGRDAFRFLYEFGTFMRHDNTTGKLEICRPHIKAIDSQMDILEGIFRTNAPAVKYGDTITLQTADYNHINFWNTCLSPEQCRRINYIVLALGDDDRNIALASHIFNHIRRYRENMGHLIIMVRCIKKEKIELLRKIAAHYNKGCDNGRYQVIRLFGNPEKIYSYDTIIRNELTAQGMTFKRSYSRLRQENETWQERHDKLSGIDAFVAGSEVVPDVDKLRSLRRKESQDMANALHAATKMWLLETALGSDCDWSDFLHRFFAADGTSTLTGRFEDLFYPGLTPEENAVMLNLAKLEHARWIAAHELLGYTPDTNTDSCDERTRSHNCMVDWEELDRASIKASGPTYVCDYKAYDYSVVDTSIALLGHRLGSMND